MKNILSSTNPTRIQTFENSYFGSVRTARAENGEVLFVAKDVLVALGYRNISKALADHVDEDDVTKRYPIVDSLGRRQMVNVINESGLYALILGSKLPSAKAFKRWVTSEVLPQIRQTGGYIPTRNARTGEALTAEEVVDKAFGIMQKTISRENLPADDCLSMRDVAKLFGMEAKALIGFLSDKRIIKSRNGRYVMTDRYAELGYDSTRIYHGFSLDGRPKVRPYLVWTPIGAAFVTKVVNGEIIAA